MKTISQTPFLVSSLTLLVIIQATLVKSDAKTFKCNGHDVTFSQKKIDDMKKCGELVGVKSMEELTPDKIACFAKCMMEGSGLVDGAGMPHKENIMKDVESSVPKEMQDVYKKALEKCIDDHGGKIKPGDASCASYAPMAMCAATAIKTICLG